MAGEAADEQINVLGLEGRFSPSARRAGARSSHQPGPDSANIEGSLDSGPPGGEDALAEGVDLNLSDDGDPGSLKSKVKASDTCEE